MLLGDDALALFREKRIIIFGVGGVGSWCAEALIRSGACLLTIVDNDTICPTNINRQIQALPETLGEEKVEALKTHLLKINPEAGITAVCRKYHESTRSEFKLREFDYVIDAIDSLSCKVDLIASALELNVTIFSAMGAARKLNPVRIQVSGIWESSICPLARMVRKRLRKRGIDKNFPCVWSDEPPLSDQFSPENMEDEKTSPTNGAMVFVTGSFGFTLASLVVQDVLDQLPGQD